MLLRTAGGPLWYDVAGQGPPLVFVSGWALSSVCWRPAVMSLREKYRCLIYDARGVGRSQPVRDVASFQMDDLAEDLHAILETAGVYDATLVGHEMGALLAALCAGRHPQDARRLALVSPRAAVRAGEVSKLSAFTPAALVLRDLASFPGIRTLVAWRFRRAPQPWRDLLYEDFADLNPRAAYETAVALTDPPAFGPLDEFIARSRLKTLLVCGDKDRRAVAEARRLFEQARAARLATLRDCGFLPMLEYPQQFARLIDDFASAAGRA